MIKLFIEKHMAVFTVAILIIVMGVMAYISLPRESSPEIKQPWVFITTVYPGVSPKDMENLVTIPIEEEIDGLEGLSKIQSSSGQSFSFVWVEFTSDTDKEIALRKVKERVDIAKASLPSEVDDPTVEEFSSSDWPIFIAMISHPDGIDLVDEPAKDLQERLKRIHGVLEVSIAGSRDKEVAIELDPLKLQHYDLTLDDVANSIRSENVNIPGGTLKSQTKNYSLNVTGEIRDPSRFEDIVVVSGPVKIPLRELADINYGRVDADSYSRLNGVPAISLELKKRTGENIIDLLDKAKAEIEDSKELFPEGTEFTYTYDESKYIVDMILDLENNMFTGFVLVILITLLFLGFRNSLFVSLAIPFSMLLSFFTLQVMGITLNMIVLFSLILALGMLVDNGIVIVENIFRHASMGKDRSQAALDGTKEVAGPIAASTLTTILAFFPIIFMPGVMGDFMKYLPITVIVVLASSLFVAVTINPVFCSQFLSISEKNRKKILEGSGLFTRFQSWYERVLRQAVKRPKRVLLGTTVIVVGGFVLYGLIGKEAVFFPSFDPSTAIINLEGRQGTPVNELDNYVEKLESIISGARTDRKYIQSNTGSSEASHKATIRVEFADFLDREISGDQSIENIKEVVKGFPGIDMTFEQQEAGPPQSKDVSYKVVGADYEVLGRISTEMLNILKGYDELKEFDSDYEPAKPEMAVEINRKKAAYYGLSTYDIASAIRNSISGATVGKFRDGEDEYDINVRYSREYRDSLNHLKNLKVSNHDGERFPIGAVADIRYKSSVAEIKRVDLQRAVQVEANYKATVQNKKEINDAIVAAFKAIDKPSGYFIDLGEGLQEQAQSTQFLMQAFMIAIFLIVVVLIAQFNSLIDPLIIVFSVFLSIGGVFWGYALSGMTFVIIMTGIGCIALAGVAVNNCIVLVDYTHLLIKDGLPWQEAVIKSGRTRLRPVLLTAITTVLGLIPMALGVSFDIHTFAVQIGSEQSEFWKAFAWAMIYGLSFATVVTLVMVPTMLTLKHRHYDKRDYKRRVRELRKQGFQDEEEENPILMPV